MPGIVLKQKEIITAARAQNLMARYGVVVASDKNGDLPITSLLWERFVTNTDVFEAFICEAGVFLVADTRRRVGGMVVTLGLQAQQHRDGAGALRWYATVRAGGQPAR